MEEAPAGWTEIVSDVWKLHHANADMPNLSGMLRTLQLAHNRRLKMVSQRTLRQKRVPGASQGECPRTVPLQA